MKAKLLHLKTEKSTQHWAAKFAEIIEYPTVMTFQGNLGAGKTTWIRAMLKALGVKDNIKSPTYALVESYDLPNTDYLIHHFDLYRIKNSAELLHLGFNEYFQENALCCIEWPEKAAGNVLHQDLNFAFTHQDLGRELIINALSPKGENILAKFIV
jgi:tRNA threonylcarbamoyladenosine biosynthesis protein TsaE